MTEDQISYLNGKLAFRFLNHNSNTCIGLPRCKNHLELVSMISDKEMVPFTCDGILCDKITEGDTVKLKNTSHCHIRMAEDDV